MAEIPPRAIKAVPRMSIKKRDTEGPEKVYISISRKRVAWVKSGGTWPISHGAAEQINEWVIDNQLGHRIAPDRWQLNSEQSVTIFLLKWS